MPRLFKYACVSARLKGKSLICREIRLCNPPLLLTIFSIIQDAAEPQMTTTKPACRDAQLFQKCSKAARKPERWECNQGNSSKNTTAFFFFGFPERYC